MRPRVFPAEDDYQRELDPDDERASMRPRVFPAEDRLYQISAFALTVMVLQ